MAYRGEIESVPPEKVWIYLCSCNSEGIEADVVFTIINHKDAERNVSSDGKAILRC